MTLQQLRYAIAVADCGSMNQAAAKLFISQPSLSEAVKELEGEIGIRIFGRTNRGITKTRNAVTCGLIADFAGIIAAILISYLFFF